MDELRDTYVTYARVTDIDINIWSCEPVSGKYSPSHAFLTPLRDIGARCSAYMRSHRLPEQTCSEETASHPSWHPLLR